MTQQEILEYNKRCADFLGVKIHESVLSQQTDHFKGYHSDWNWVMEVVEKIESEGFDFKINTQWNPFNECSYTQVSVVLRVGEMSSDRKCVYNSVNVYEKHTATLRDKKEAVVQAVNDVLIWYNDQKQGKNV